MLCNNKHLKCCNGQPNVPIGCSRTQNAKEEIINSDIHVLDKSIVLSIPNPLIGAVSGFCIFKV